MKVLYHHVHMMDVCLAVAGVRQAHRPQQVTRPTHPPKEKPPPSPSPPPSDGDSSDSSADNNGAVGDEETIPIKYCDEETSPRWDIHEDAVCAGQEDFTLVKGSTTIYETDPYDDDDGYIEDSWQYDGTLEKCQEVFVMDYWERLYSPDIKGGLTWLTWDPKDSSCKLYSNKESCRELRSGPGTQGMISAQYCNFNS